MPGVSRRPRGQIPLPGDRGHDPPPSPCRGLARAFTRHERRTDSSEKSNNPSAAGAGCEPVLGAGGAQGGPSALPPALGSRIRRYLFLDQPPAPTGSRLGSPASADSASPCPRPRCCCAGLQPPGSCRTDSGVTAGGPAAAPAAPSRAGPCHPTPHSRHGRGRCRSHGTRCRAQLAGHSPAWRPPASSSSPSHGRPRPAASPAPP